MAEVKKQTRRWQMAENCILCEEGDKRIRSVAAGICGDCGEILNCPTGCYKPTDYSDDSRSAAALDQGVCLVCGGKVDCPAGHLAAEPSSLLVRTLIRRADELWLS